MWHILCFVLLGVAASAPMDQIVTSFSSKQWNRCTSDWITCPQIGKPVAEFTQFYAQDAVGFRDRVGPISLLPDNENQILVDRYDHGHKYLMWVDATETPPRVLNCTRAKTPRITNKTHWALGFTGFLEKYGEFNRTIACENGTVSSCQEWDYNHTFPNTCMQHEYLGSQPMGWTLAPLANDKLFLGAFTNDIFYPTDMPAACVTSGSHKFWHWNFYNDFSTSIDDSLFDVPDDDACPLQGDHEFEATLQSSYVRFRSMEIGLPSSPIVV